MSAPDDFDTALVACAAAVAAEDWAAAKLQLALAEVHNARMAVEARHSESTIRNRERLDGLRDIINDYFAESLRSDRDRFIVVGTKFA